MVMPRWIKKKTFESYLNYIQDENLPEMNFASVKDLLWLGNYL